MNDAFLTGYTNQVFSTLTEAQEECHKLSPSKESPILFIGNMADV